jgi:hypothetical protein
VTDCRRENDASCGEISRQNDDRASIARFSSDRTIFYASQRRRRASHEISDAAAAAAAAGAIAR